MIKTHHNVGGLLAERGFAGRAAALSFKDDGRSAASGLRTDHRTHPFRARSRAAHSGEVTASGSSLQSGPDLHPGDGRRMYDKVRPAFAVLLRSKGVGDGRLQTYESVIGLRS